MSESRSSLQIQSTVKSDSTLELRLASVEVPAPGPDQVVIRVEASPINPSDLGLLFGGADMDTARASGTPEAPVVVAEISPPVMRAMSARVDQPLAVGNEGAGVVVDAGSSDAAQALLGKTVTLVGRQMYSQFRLVNASQCLVLDDDTTPAEGASIYVNPMTALCMVEVMRQENHKALVHTAAASNLGQMLQRICLADDIDLVNIVRKPEQEAILRHVGAKYVCDTSKSSFQEDLVDALAETGATLAFDALGGGTSADKILSAMEKAASRNATEYSVYGSSTHKQVYIYGGLELGETQLTRNYGMAWGVGAWLLPIYLGRAGQETQNRLQRRVVDEIKTTFASHYTREVSLAEVLTLDAIRVYAKRATGEKYLVNPSL